MMQPDRKSFDFAEHRHAYQGFVRLTLIVVFLLLSHLVALAVGGVAHLWLLACLEVALSIVAAVVGAAIPGLDWKPGAAVLAFCLLTLAIAAG
ncbi:aa3-type cytochrome c oxidase subunit IV [Labrys sp. La1]|uniref:aa3-type cytochrome c oxidase subunit IV n=1 Tax=Labrys sp. La1 TaxID=3404917 RepID=UPI003EBF0C74